MIYWLVETDTHQLEIWTETEHEYRLMKCEYYGARPFWKKLKKIEPAVNGLDRAKVGEVIPYAKSSIGKHFALILELFFDRGQRKFKGIDLATNEKVVAPLA